MDENRNVQTDVELSDEELEQTAGGMYFLGFTFTCPQCGKMYDTGSVPYTCSCGKVFAVQPE